MVANGCDIPEGYDIHHIDGNKLNNSITNLELIDSFKHRSLHGKGKVVSEETRKKISKNGKGKNKGYTPWNKGLTNIINSKPVLQIDKKTKEIIAEYPSTNEVERKLGFNQGHIVNVCNNKPNHKTAYGYIWKYK